MISLILPLPREITSALGFVPVKIAHVETSAPDQRQIGANVALIRVDCSTVNA
jgi:hypothetical protein